MEFQVLGGSAAATVGRNHLDAIGGHQHRIERVAVVAAVADQAPLEVFEEPGLERGGDEVRLMR
jgi:hypothetical protein